MGWDRMTLTARGWAELAGWLAGLSTGGRYLRLDAIPRVS